MITREEAKYNLHIEMLKQSFQREGDGMTSILLGNATSTAFNFFEKHIDQLEQHIKSLEAQLVNTEQLTCNVDESWEPKKGEWCWNIERKTLGYIKEITNEKHGSNYYFFSNINGIESYASYTLDRFMPFIGELPIFLKDTQ